MPELPEVETVRSDLERFVTGKKVIKITIKQDFVKKIQPSAAEFVSSLENERLAGIYRRGKMLVFDFGPNKKVLAHLKMTGQFVFVSPRNELTAGGHPIDQEAGKPMKFNKVHFDFGSAGDLFFNDMRKFGYFKLVGDEEAEREMIRFGLEPHTRSFTIKKFEGILERRPRWEIKKFLLAQDLIAGVGNIYADECLFAAGIRGDRPVASLAGDEIEKLFAALKRIMAKAIKYRGTSVSDYVDGRGNKGGYARFLNVYKQAGKICHRCGRGQIQKTKLAGRGTSYCPVCQK
ncbi:TPA: hypothetical protein DF272_06365 [Candidatus Falkowbacteria bacterium]|nr:hypothetical protein [Candidatus Falkowbacteria bacterium]